MGDATDHAETAKAIIARANLFSGAPCAHTNVLDLDDHCAWCLEDGIAEALAAAEARAEKAEAALAEALVALERKTDEAQDHR